MTRAGTLLRRYPAALAIVLIVAVTAGVFVWGGRDVAGRAAVGEVLRAAGDFGKEDGAMSRTLRIPTGELAVAVTAPRSSTGVRADVSDRRAPDGGTFLGVSVTTTQLLLPQPAVADVADPPVTVALVADGRRFPLPPALDANDYRPAERSVWVAVDGRPDDVRVEVTYDGLTQSVDLRTGVRRTGAAAPLYRLTPATTRQDCSRPTIANGFDFDPDRSLPRCTVRRLGGLPYLPGRGWADEGTVWFAALVGVDDVPGFRRGRTDYRATSGGSGPTLTASVPGSAPAVLLPVTPSDFLPIGGSSRLAAFRVPVGVTPVLTVTATYRDLVAFNTTVPDRTVLTGPSADVSWKVTS